MSGKCIDLVGKVFGRLTVVARADIPSNRHGMSQWLCRCECGIVKTVQRRHLTTGDVKSCGCLRKERNHGLRTHLVYGVWAEMIQRCTNPNCQQFKHYGGRGITVCERWLGSFRTFFEDMGPRPDKHEIDRIDNNGNYEPGNCRWVTRSQQLRNTRQNRHITHAGKTMTLVEWSEQTDLAYLTIFKRLKRGWPVESALTTPSGCRPLHDDLKK